MSVLTTNVQATEIHSSTPTLRLTTAQAVVRYLQKQFSERMAAAADSSQACLAFSGTATSPEIGQALEECGADLPYFQPCNEQSMVHTATGYAKANQRLATLACTVLHWSLARPTW